MLLRCLQIATFSGSRAQTCGTRSCSLWFNWVLTIGLSTIRGQLQNMATQTTGSVKKTGAGLQAVSGAKDEAARVRGKAGNRQLMTLPEQIAERIFTAIADGEYAPGDRIREEVLAEQFEVSRGPVREALRILEKDAVVRILPNRGAHVTQLSIQEVSDLFEIRRKLSGATVARLSGDEAVALAT